MLSWIIIVEVIVFFLSKAQKRHSVKSAVSSKAPIRQKRKSANPSKAPFRQKRQSVKSANEDDEIPRGDFPDFEKKRPLLFSSCELFSWLAAKPGITLSSVQQPISLCDTLCIYVHSSYICTYFLCTCFVHMYNVHMSALLTYVLTLTICMYFAHVYLCRTCIYKSYVSFFKLFHYCISGLADFLVFCWLAFSRQTHLKN